jgi:hypothetical protein
VPTISLLTLLITAGLVALVLLWPRVRTGPLGARLAAEMAIATLVLATLLCGLVMAAQRLPW